MNQPAGFQAAGNRRPSYYYGRRHDYVYYPIAWIDTATGTFYEKGYYDENGQLYEDVAFEKNGKYENVVCHCPYCGQDSILNLDADKVGMQSLQCPNCNGPMEIKSQLDAYSGDAAESVQRSTAARPKKKRRGLIVLIVLAVLWLIGRFGADSETPKEPVGQNAPIQQIAVSDSYTSSNTGLFGEVVSLVRVGDGSYAIVSGGQNADKQMVWVSEEDSYYDADSDCWLWYNTDVEPAVWQYWYEGISSDFGDFGWMEHDDSGWYIEAAAGSWIQLPGGYSTDGLWYIAD